MKDSDKAFLARAMREGRVSLFELHDHLGHDLWKEIMDLSRRLI